MSILKVPEAGDVFFLGGGTMATALANALRNGETVGEWLGLMLNARRFVQRGIGCLHHVFEQAGHPRNVLDSDELEILADDVAWLRERAASEQS